MRDNNNLAIKQVDLRELVRLQQEKLRENVPVFNFGKKENSTEKSVKSERELLSCF